MTKSKHRARGPRRNQQCNVRQKGWCKSETANACVFSFLQVSGFSNEASTDSKAVAGLWDLYWRFKFISGPLRAAEGRRYRLLAVQDILAHPGSRKLCHRHNKRPGGYFNKQRLPLSLSGSVRVTVNRNRERLV
jgi:hypothetical protein